MPQNMLRTGLDWLTTSLAANAADEVIYSRGGDSVVVRATYGEKLLRLDDGEGGVRIEWADLDFCIPADQLVIAAEAIEPKRGDMIYVTGSDGATRTYRVSPLDGDQCYRSIHLGSMVRVHTKHVGTEPYS